MGNTMWRSEPTNVEKLADEVWLAVKCQSKAELAGSPRNVFKCSGFFNKRGKALFLCGLVTRYQIKANSEYSLYKNQ